MTRRLCSLGLLFALSLTGTPARSAEPDTLAADRATLHACDIDTDTDSLVIFLRRRAASPETRARIDDLLGKLASEEFAEREKARVALIEIGAPARDQLRLAARGPDAEVRRLAAAALEQIRPARGDDLLLPAAARVVASRKPDGACALLLDCLASVDDPDTAEGVARALDAVALAADGKPERALIEALADRSPTRRWAAAGALVRTALATHRAAILPLLADEDATVRRQVASALVHARDKAGIPALIRLLDGQSADDAGAAADLLARIAREKAPLRPENPRKAWEAWYADAEAGLDLARVDLAARGDELLVGLFLFANRSPHALLGLDRTGRLAWEITDVEFPIYARKVRHDRVLVCEAIEARVTERDLQGRILWTKKLDADPYHARRLLTGNTFIATRNQLLEVAPNGKEVVSIRRPTDDVVAATPNADGTFTVVATGGVCLRLDRTGRQLASFKIGDVFHRRGFKADFLPDGGLVLPEEMANRISEYDRAGKLVAQVAAREPLSVNKLANGNYLVGRLDKAELVEVAPDGKRVSVKPVPKNNNGEGMKLFFAERH